MDYLNNLNDDNSNDDNINVDNINVDNLLDNLMDKPNSNDMEKEPSENEAGNKKTNTDGKGKISLEELKSNYDKLSKSFEDLQQFTKQKVDEVENLKTWREKLMGLDKNDDDYEKQRQELELKFNENPIDVIQDLINKAVSNVDTKLQTNNNVQRVEKAMSEIEKNYIVDWDKDWQKITEKLKYFSEEAKSQMPKDVLLNACRLAGVIKVRDKQLNTPYFESGLGNGYSPQAKKSLSDDIKKSILSAKPKNVLKF